MRAVVVEKVVDEDVRATLEAGAGFVRVNGTRIEVGPDPYRDAIDVVVSTIARPQGRVVRLTIRDRHGDVCVRVHPDGTVTDFLPVKAASGRLAATAEGEPSARPRAGVRRPRLVPSPDRGIAAAVLACAVVIGALVIVVGSVVGDGRPDRSTPTSTSTPAMLRTELTVADPPAEWAARARWKTPPLLPAAGRVVVVDGDSVAMVTNDRRVALVRAGTGDVLWSRRIPSGEVHSGLALTVVGERVVLALHVGDRLVWWSVADGAAGELRAPASATVTYAGDEPLVLLSAHEAALVRPAGDPSCPDDGCDQLARTSLPAGAAAYAAYQGTIVAAAKTGWWRLIPGNGVGEVTAWPGSDTLPVAWVDERLLTIRAVPGETAGTAQLLDLATGTAAWSTPITLPGPQVTWRPSPTRQWGILGRTLLDLRERTATDLGPQWVGTTAIASDRAMGRFAGQRVLVGPSIPVGVLGAEEGFPEDLVRLPHGEVGALVRGSDQSVYLLPER